MVFYVALVAILNIGLGYLLATYLNGAGQRNSLTNSAARYTSYRDLDDDEYYSDEPYDGDMEDAELEAAVAR